MTACPTPTKTRYATQGAAETAAARVSLSAGLPMRPYECPCTWWHLTKTPAEIIPEPASASQLAIERLNSIPDIDFREFVAADVRGEGAHDDRAALRHPRNLKRWQRQLGELIRDIEQQLRERRDDKTPAGLEWRRRGLDYRERLTRRATECRRRRSEVHVEMTRRQDFRRRDAEVALAAGASVKELRARAGEIAVQRLIDAHGEEFARYCAEEFRALGLTVPERIAKRERPAVTPNRPAA